MVPSSVLQARGVQDDDEICSQPSFRSPVGHSSWAATLDLLKADEKSLRIMGLEDEQVWCTLFMAWPLHTMVLSGSTEVSFTKAALMLAIFLPLVTFTPLVTLTPLVTGHGR